MAEWEDLLADLKVSSIVCAVAGVLLLVLAISQTCHVPGYSFLECIVNGTVVFFPMVFIPFGVSWLKRRLEDSGWVVFGGIVFFVVLLVIVSVAAFFLGFLAFLWRLKEIYDAKDEIAFIKEHIAELEREQAEAYT